MSACAPRWATPRTESRQTLGGTAATIAEALGTPLMAWQRQVLDTALEVDPAGHLAFRDVVLTVPRQSGKTTIALALIILRALSAPRQQIRYTSQTGLDARKKWSDDWLPVLEQSPFTRYFKVRMANGHEALCPTMGAFNRWSAPRPSPGTEPRSTWPSWTNPSPTLTLASSRRYGRP